MKSIAGSHYSVGGDGKIYQGKHPVPVLNMGGDDKGNPRLYAPSDANNLDSHLKPKELGGKGCAHATEADVLASLRAINAGAVKSGKVAPYPDAEAKPVKAAEVVK